MSKHHRFAVILCGSGFLDGSEIRESVGVLWALSECGAEVNSTTGPTVSIFAPNENQFDVVNHFKKEPAPETRNALHEAARIARSQVTALDQLDPDKFDALLLPGGFGAAKTLSSFAREGAKGKTHPKLESVIQSFFRSGKPLGAVCIAPALVALSIRDQKLELTLGEPGEAAQEIEKLGHRHQPCGPNSYWRDPHFPVFSTPAYMFDHAKLSDIYDGILGMVRALVTELKG